MTDDLGRRRGRSQSRDLERYAALFAGRTRSMRSSAMRDVMSLAQGSNIISLAGGLPDTSSFGSERFRRLMSAVAADAADALQYGPTEGLRAVAEVIAQVMAAEDTRIDPDDVLVTTGGQQVIELMCKTFVDAGDVIIAEGPTYPGAVPCFYAYEADVIQIGMDEDGMRIDELEQTLAALDEQGRAPKFIYTIPNFQNPGGVTLSLPRRKRLVEVARERELLVLEDNPYGLLRYEGEQLPTLYSLDGGEYVVYLGTFSKILSAGLRLGWAVAPPPIYEKLNLGKQGADLCTSSLAQHFVLAYFADGDWRAYLDELCLAYRSRRDAMLGALERHFPAGASWTRPRGGLFCWATLPEFIDTTDLLARALRENVAFVPGSGAYLDGRGGSSMRLNFSGVDESRIEEGVRRLGEVIGEQVELFSALTGAAPASPHEDEAAPRPELDNVLRLPAPRTRRDRGAG